MTYNEALDLSKYKIGYAGENMSEAEIDRVMKKIIADAFGGIDITDFYYIRDVVWTSYRSAGFRSAIIIADYADRYLHECPLYLFLQGKL